jgi:uncharacterized protein (UPF0548 family)
VTIALLDPARAAKLKRAPLTYSRDVISGHMPAGYRVLRRERVLAGVDLAVAAHALMHWQVHAGARLHVAASAEEVRVGEVVVLTLGVGRCGLRAPCRVLDVIDEPARRGFVYGTLPGHPEAGEESFVLHRADDGTITFTVSAVSRPARLLSRLGGPLTRRVQLDMVERYLRAAARPAGECGRTDA